MAVSDSGIPLPVATTTSAVFWQRVREHRFSIQHCLDCGRDCHPPLAICPACHGSHFDWLPVTGDGKIFTFTVVHRAPIAAFRVPYMIALVTLNDFSVNILSNVVNCDLSSIAIGTKVRMVYEDMTPDITLYKFEPWPA